MSLNEIPASILQDATGWAAVLFIVRWMMSRMDRLIDNNDKSITAFQKFQEQEERTHQALVDTQERILSELKDLKSHTLQ
jgi:hypothetical protein